MCKYRNYNNDVQPDRPEPHRALLALHSALPDRHTIESRKRAEGRREDGVIRERVGATSMSFTCRQPQWDANSIKWFKVMRRRFNDAFSSAKRGISLPSPSPLLLPPVLWVAASFCGSVWQLPDWHSLTNTGNLTLAVEIEDVDSVKVVRDIWSSERSVREREKH